MNDERFLATWLRDTSGGDTDVRAVADRLAVQLSATRQRRRWWPLVPGHHSGPTRRSARPTDTLTHVTGRTHLMFSPVKAFATVAFVLMAGGLLSVSLPARDDRAAPGAEAPVDTPPALVHGQMSPVWSEITMEGVRDDGSSFSYSGWQGSRLSANDPRMSGRFDWLFSSAGPSESDPPNELTGGVATVLVRIVNDDGAWSGPTSYISLDDPDWETLSGWLTGTGAYEGLATYIVMDTDTFELMGYITPAGPPPAPEGFPDEAG